MDGSGAVTIRLSCPASEAGGCEGTLSLDLSRRRRVKLGQSSFQIAGGGNARVKVRLSKKSRRLVKRLKKIRVAATIEARDHAGNAVTTKRTLTLRRRPNSKKRYST
jgi:hypothetical protein